MQEAAGDYSIMVLSKADIMTADVDAGDTGEREVGVGKKRFCAVQW
jgi:hypothetical protein